MYLKEMADVEASNRCRLKGNKKFKNRINFATIAFLYVFGAYLLTNVVTRINGIGMFDDELALC